MAPEEGWVGFEDVATHLKVAKESIYRWIDSKGFPAHQVGRLLRFKLPACAATGRRVAAGRSEVDAWVTTRAGDDSASDAPAGAPRAGGSGKTAEAGPAGRLPAAQRGGAAQAGKPNVKKKSRHG